MFFRIIGNYLVDEGALTKQQLGAMMEYRLKNRVRLGILAVEEDMMTLAQADEINRLQALMDKRFGDIAISKGYLKDDDVSKLISKQGNPYILFLQGVQELNYLSKDELLEHMNNFKIKYSLTDDMMKVILDGSADEVAGALLRCDNEQADAIIKLALRNIVRFISNDIWFGQIEKTDGYKAEHLACQKMSGDMDMILGFSCKNQELLTIASTYAKEHFPDLSADAYDSVCEFINCIDGLYARAYSVDGKELELHPPVFSEKTVLDGEVYALPIKVNNEPMTIVVKAK